MSMTKAGDINIEYYVEGSGPPLLMIMGFAGSAHSWGEPFVEQLTAALHRDPPLQPRDRRQRQAGGAADDPHDGGRRGRSCWTALGIERAHVLASRWAG